MKPCGVAGATCPGRDQRIVPSEIPDHPVRLMIIGEGPGRNELQEGRPFIGASGKMLQRGLKTIDLKRSDVAWSNAVLCDVKPHQLPAARKCCEQRLHDEIAKASPEILAPVGGLALQSVMRTGKKQRILNYRGSVTKQETGPVIAPTIHPAFAMRSKQWLPILEIDVARWGRLLAASFVPPEEAPHRQTIFAREFNQIEEAIGAWPAGAPVSFDVETVGLGPTSTGLVCFGMSDGVTTLVVPWTRGQDGRIPWWNGNSQDVIDLVNDAIATRSVVTHNGPAFDHIVARRYGLKVVTWEDTLLASHATTGHLKKALDQVVTRYLDVPPWKQWPHAESLEQLWSYNARDALYTILTWLEKRKEVAA